MQENYKIEWQSTKAAIFRPNLNRLRAVKEIDFVDIDSLVGLTTQKTELLANTKQFLDGFLANHALLWGEMGSGKSSLCKAVFTKFFDEGLKVIEIAKDNLSHLPDIIDEIRELKEYKFIIYIDDLSFSRGDDGYKYLKPLMEGSIEKPPVNALIYATSNLRHLVSEEMDDNFLHKKDSVSERLSLSDRFGLTLSFYSSSQKEYLDIVDSYFRDFKGDRELLHLEAVRFAMGRASRSGRVARQFYHKFRDKF
ncbi:MAG: ATP-binding protein [Campylobacteraceae bacterium]|nr:ATP-binding protein [Campylobacteraceae bacterium]